MVYDLAKPTDLERQQGNPSRHQLKGCKGKPFVVRYKYAKIHRRHHGTHVPSEPKEVGVSVEIELPDLGFDLAPQGSVAYDQEPERRILSTDLGYDAKKAAMALDSLKATHDPDHERLGGKGQLGSEPGAFDAVRVRRLWHTVVDTLNAAGRQPGLDQASTHVFGHRN